MTIGLDLDYAAGTVPARGYYARPANGRIKGGVILVHEAPGVGAHVRRRADALAAHGYAALAADLYGHGHLAANPQEARQWVEALKADPDELIDRMTGALDALVKESGGTDGNLAAAGYCFGGWCALELARTGAPLRSVSTFHGSLASERGAGRIRGAVLACAGDTDPFIPIEQIVGFSAEMREAQVDYQVCLYGGVSHGFTDVNTPTMPGFRYDATADRRAWQTFLSLLAEHTADPEQGGAKGNMYDAI